MSASTSPPIPTKCTKLLTQIAMDVRNSDEFKNVFLQDPQVLGVDAVKGSQVIFPVVFKTAANPAIWPRCANSSAASASRSKKHHMLPGDPYRVFTADGRSATRPAPELEAEEACARARSHDPQASRRQIRSASEYAETAG